jgi:hypothetical protein
MGIDLTFFEISEESKLDANFGRQMMDWSEDCRSGDIAVEILNAMSRVGEYIAETSPENRVLSKIDTMVIDYARNVL